jgi:hypothetical protein
LWSFISISLADANPGVSYICMRQSRFNLQVMRTSNFVSKEWERYLIKKFNTYYKGINRIPLEGFI